MKLCNPIYRETASYGHMGRQPEVVKKVFDSIYWPKVEKEVELFTWEKLDYVDEIKQMFKPFKKKPIQPQQGELAEAPSEETATPLAQTE